MAASIAQACMLVVDDFQPWRRLVREMMSEVPTLRVIGEASNGLEAIEKAEKLRPDIILMDIEMPVVNGFDAWLIINARVPTCKVVFFTSECDPEALEYAHHIGAWGYVCKSKVGDLITALKVLSHGNNSTANPT